MKMKRRDKHIQEKLDAIRHSRTRTLMPRPTVFKDRSKYDRARAKNALRKECV